MYYLLSFVIPNPYAIIVLWKRDFLKNLPHNNRDKNKIKAARNIYRGSSN